MPGVGGDKPKLGRKAVQDPVQPVEKPVTEKSEDKG